MRSQIVSLQVGRGLAALAIVIQHAALSVGTGPPATLYAGLIAYLGVGVDFFFVLSGFIILTVHLHDEPGLKSAAAFLRRRLTRIFIPYIPIALAMIGVLQLVPGISTDEHRQWNVVRTLTLLPVGGFPALPVAWSLTFELTFYLLFMSVYLLRRPFGLGFGMAFAAVCLAARSNVAWDELQGIFQSTYALEFAYGMAAAFVVQGLRRHLRLVPNTGLILVGGYLTSLGFSWRPLMGAGIAILVLSVTQLGHLHQEVSFVSAWVRLGDASYSVYLVHGPAIAVLSRVLVFQPWWAVVILYIVLSTAAGVYYHMMIERPLIGRFR